MRTVFESLSVCLLVVDVDVDVDVVVAGTVGKGRLFIELSESEKLLIFCDALYILISYRHIGHCE